MSREFADALAAAQTLTAKLKPFAQIAEYGVMDKLKELGMQDGDTVRIGEFELDYVF